MKERANGDVKLGRGIDHLGWLNAQLRDLSGNATLASELIQNADDSPGATRIVFDVTDDALIVDNDGHFVDCGQAEEDECLGRDGNGRGLCDFHRFRNVASGDKRQQADTVGAFGIGFVAVYQITDRPELISSGRHWTVDETAIHEERITACHNQGCWHSEVDVATRFILPWAIDADSPLRKALGLEVVSQDSVADVSASLLDFLPNAFLFLNKLERADLKRNGKTTLSLERLADAEQVLITADGVARTWRVFSGDFAKEAAELRAEGHLTGVEKSSRVSVAVPENPDELKSGLFYAFLPTQERTELPIHINADFFPSSDRKRLILESGYQAEWNRLAIQCAAETVAAHLESLHEFVSADRFWAIVEAVELASHDDGTSPVKNMWTALAEALRSSRVVLGADGELHQPRDTLWPTRDPEFAATELIVALGATIVHPSLRNHASILKSTELGLPRLSMHEAAVLFRDQGLTREVCEDNLPEALRSEEARSVLWAALESLDDGCSSSHRGVWRGELATCAIAPTTGDTYAPFHRIFQCDSEAERIFSTVCGKSLFACSGTSADALIEKLCPRFGPSEAIGLIRDAVLGGLGLSEDDAVDMLRWFAHHEAALLDGDLGDALSALPLFPAGDTLLPLEGLALPSGFVDPLGIAHVVNTRHLNGLESFLRGLGADELDLHRYVVDQVEQAFSERPFDGVELRSLLEFLASHLAELETDEEARATLASLPLLPGEAGEPLTPNRCYFPSPLVSSVLPDADTFDDSLLTRVMRAFLEWLGVALDPRPADVQQRIRDLCKDPPIVRSASAIQGILRFLIAQWSDDGNLGWLSQLTGLAWLPAEGDRASWHEAKHVYTAFRRYAFESQALFLDLPYKDQTRGAALLAKLGVTTEPPVRLVVRHLLDCASRKQAVNEGVYSILNDHPADPALYELLAAACIMTADGEYSRPDQVYWSEHPFGRFRKRLDPSLRSLARFLDAVGVKEQPGPEDAAAVLRDIEGVFGEFNTALDDSSMAIVAGCWRMLSEALEDEAFDDGLVHQLRDRKVVPNRSRLLTKPPHLFLDDRPGWVEVFGSFMNDNVVDPIQDAIPAWQEAGVRSLSEAVERTVVIQGDRSADRQLKGLLSERREEIARALSPHLPGSGVRDAIDQLDNTSCDQQGSVDVMYEINAFGLRTRVGPNGDSACWDVASGTIFRATDVSCSDVSVAKELAYGLCPANILPGPVALAIHSVLSAKSAAAAHGVLDELGYAQVDLNPFTATSDEAVTHLGTDDEIPPAPTPQVTSVECEDESGASAAIEEDEACETRDHPEEDQADDAGDVEVERKGTFTDGDEPGGRDRPKRQRERGSSGGSTGGSGDGSGGGSGTSRKQGRYGTYVMPDGATVDGSGDGDDGSNAVIEQAGVDRVVAYEEAHFRFPKVMPPNNPGYDIESSDGSDEIVRYIEVKATAEDWLEAGVGLTAREYEEARERREYYWLYVVARAGQADECLYRIQDPATRANRYFFDFGWRKLAED